MNQAVTFLTDGGDDVRNLATEMAPYAEHHLDWFHITMRLTVLGQCAKGLIHHDQEAGERVARDLLRIKRYLWYGNSRAALFWSQDLADDLYGLEEDYTYPNLKAFSQAVAEFVTYIERNAHAIPNYGERYRNDERIATSFVESAVNVVIAKRFTADAMVAMWRPHACRRSTREPLKERSAAGSRQMRTSHQLKPRPHEI